MTPHVPKVIAPVFAPSPKDEVTEELGFHIEMTVRANLAKGMSEEDARADAVARLGDVGRVKAECASSAERREARMRWRNRWEDVVQDVRHALRQLRRDPAFACVAVLTLGLGIGASTSIFSVVDGVLLTPLSYAHADRIVAMRVSTPAMPWMSPDDFLDWKERSRSFEHMGMYRWEGRTYTGGNEPLRVVALFASDGYLSVLDAKAEVGRSFDPGEYVEEDPRVALLDYGFWVRAFGADPGVVGQSIVLDGVSVDVVGVLPEGWRPLEPTGADIVVPWRWTRKARRNGASWVRTVGLRRKDVSQEALQAEMTAISAALEVEYPEQNTGERALAVPLEDALFGSARPQLLMFLAGACLVLLITCINVANMTLTKSVVRARELSVRVALGAGRSRIVGQLLTESLVLAAVGGVVGVVVAVFALQAFGALAPAQLLPRMEQVGVQPLALAFAAGVSLLSGVLFGVLPAAALNRAGGFLVLRGRSIGGSVGSRLARDGLIVLEVGLAVVLLIGSGLLTKSLAALNAENPGFAVEDRLYFSVPISSTDYPVASDLFDYAEVATERLSAIPGVTSVAAAPALPILGGWDTGTWGLEFEGTPVPEDRPMEEVHVFRVTSHYLETLGTPLLRGRDLRATDGSNGDRVALVSESFVRKYFPNDPVIGQRVRLWGSVDDPPWAEIVGVVADVQADGLGRATPPQVYVPLDQQARHSPVLLFVVRSLRPPGDLTAAIRTTIASLDPDQPITRMGTMEEMMAGETALHRFRASLMGGFGGVSLLLAIVGVYGSLSFVVSQRSREIGVRMALGATRQSVFGLVLRGATPVITVGVVGGLGVAMVLTRVVESMLYGIAPRDASVFLGAPTLLLVTAFLSMLPPARRAASVDPMETLTEE